MVRGAFYSKFDDVLACYQSHNSTAFFVLLLGGGSTSSSSRSLKMLSVLSSQKKGEQTCCSPFSSPGPSSWRRQSCLYSADCGKW
jgi:hypothetical protein